MKKILIYATGLFALIGAVLISFVFGISMQPSEKVLSERSQHDIASLLPGHYRIDSFKQASYWDASVLLIKDWDEKIYAYILPTKSGKVSLNEFWSTWGYYYCTDFRPELNEDNSIKRGGIIKCHDKEQPEWGVSFWQWEYNGLPKKEWGIKMFAPAFEIANGTIYINK